MANHSNPPPPPPRTANYSRREIGGYFYISLDIAARLPIDYIKQSSNE